MFVEEFHTLLGPIITVYADTPPLSERLTLARRSFPNSVKTYTPRATAVIPNTQAKTVEGLALTDENEVAEEEEPVFDLKIFSNCGRTSLINVHATVLG
mmetsp:Transcript_13384/g.19324  ORF Transcript_13384/g.19324 Transcript_13384/m.19324 type:complete len:99 (-) Transcript_13384:2-298(-)